MREADAVVTSVAILGCGPSGLIAAHALDRNGYEPHIISKRVKSQIHGAMFLHKQIPGVPVESFSIDVIKVGCKEGYADNVYGDPNHPVSWNNLESGTVRAWSSSETYTTLWEQFNSEIIDVEIDASMVAALALEYEYMISTIPLPAICLDRNHTFEAQDIWIAHGIDSTLIPGVNDGNMMYYNGYTRDGRYGMIGHRWYRFSLINGYSSWEYTHEPEYDGRWMISAGRKPIWTDCDCHPQVHRAGRFGKWEKQVLTHHVFEEIDNVVL